MFKDSIESLEQKYRKTYLSYWKDFHRHPELSYSEFRTSDKVSNALNSLDLEVKTDVGGTGVVGLLRGKEEGPTVALRADMDALEIEEKSGCNFASENKGIMHACGHDSHTAMLLGSAHILSEMKDYIKGNIKFIFQPAEEGAPMGGAQGMLEDGVLDDPKVSAILAIHVWPTLNTGEIGIREGAMSAASDRLQISLLGKSTHASTPEYGIDTVVMSAQVISALQTLISRNVSPLDSAVITIAKIAGGAKHNIIPDRVELDGTVRTFFPATRKLIARRIEEAVLGVAKAMGGTCEINYRLGYPPVINDPKITQIARNSIKDATGERGLRELDTPNLGGEDFSFYGEKVPAAFAWVGCKPLDVPIEEFPKLHNNMFLPDEKALPFGVRYLCHAALNVIGELEKSSN